MLQVINTLKVMDNRAHEDSKKFSRSFKALGRQTDEIDRTLRRLGHRLSKAEKRQRKARRKTDSRQRKTDSRQRKTDRRQARAARKQQQTLDFLIANQGQQAVVADETLHRIRSLDDQNKLDRHRSRTALAFIPSVKAALLRPLQNSQNTPPNSQAAQAVVAAMVRGG